MIKKNSFYSPLIEQTCFCPIICPFTANSSRLSCVNNADFVQEPEDTTVPSTKATLGQSDGVRKVAHRGGSGCHISLNISVNSSFGYQKCIYRNVYIKAGFANYLAKLFIDFKKLDLSPKLFEKCLVFFCYIFT